MKKLNDWLNFRAEYNTGLVWKFIARTHREARDRAEKHSSHELVELKETTDATS